MGVDNSILTNFRYSIYVENLLFRCYSLVVNKSLKKALFMKIDTQKDNLMKIWSRTLDVIETKLNNPQTFDAYFDQTKLMSLSETTAIITTGSNVAAKILSTSSFAQVTISALKEVTQTEYSIRFIEEKDYNKKMGSDAIAISGEGPDRFFVTAKLNKDYTFDNFVKGPSNMDAYQAALLSVTSPGLMNPVFLYSTTGYGKTHLLNAIGNAYMQKFPGKKVLYTNTDQFIDEFVKYATGNSDNSAFKEFFKSIDILLIDDIQFLKGKSATSTFFFNVFNAMIQAGKQVVITSDRSPSELEGLEDRLVSRFTGALSIKINKPQPDTMLDILKVKIASLQLDLDMFAPEALQYLVNHNPGNIRAMEGDLKKLIFISTTRQNIDKIDLEFCRQAFGDRKGKGAGEKEPISPAKIISAVSSYYNVSETQIRSKVRTLQIAMARQISMYLCRTVLDMSFNDIGKEFGRDHSTVITAVKKVSDQLKTDRALQASITEINKKLNSKTVVKSI